MLKSQLELFFPHINGGNSGDGYAEFDAEIQVGGTSRRSKLREGGVWVRKPRSSRPGSGGAYTSSDDADSADQAEAFIVCRNFDPSKVPLPITFPPDALDALAKQTTGTLTLESLAHLTGHRETAAEWEAIKAYVGSGDLE